MLRLLLFLIFLSTGSLLAQQTDTTVQIGLKPKVFAKILNQQFSGLVTGQSKNAIGNFASLDVKDAELSFAGNSILKNGSVFGIKATGGVTDGLFEIFSASKLNTQVGMDFQYHFLALKNKSLTYYEDSYRQQQMKERKIRNESALRIAFIESNQVKDSLERAIEDIGVKLTKLQTLLANETVDRKKDSLRFEITSHNIKLNFSKKSLETLPPMDALIMDAENARSVAIKENETAVELYGFKFGWFSLGYKFENKSLKLFSPTEAFADQIVKDNFISHEVTMQYSYYSYSQSPFESLFLDLGAGFGVTDNLQELDKVEITETEIVGTSGIERAVTNTYNVYKKSEYESSISSLRLYGDVYYFLFKGNMAAVHVFPELIVKERYKPLSNFGIGFLISFKDKEDESSNANAELYYNFMDVFEVKTSDYSFFERNSIGLRFSFPINFKAK